MTTLHIELQVRDYDMSQTAFGGDAGGRQQAGMRRYRIFRPIDDPHRVMIQGDFDNADQAKAFLEVMRANVWSDPTKAPAKLGAPRTHIVEMVEGHEY